MKVKDLISRLKKLKPDYDIVLKHSDCGEEVVNLQMRVYVWNDRVIIDGWDKE